jgi:hypothetical protein
MRTVSKPVVTKAGSEPGVMRTAPKPRITRADFEPVTRSWVGSEAGCDPDRPGVAPIVPKPSVTRAE